MRKLIRKIFKRSVLDTEDYMNTLGSSKVLIYNGYANSESGGAITNMAMYKAGAIRVSFGSIITLQYSKAENIRLRDYACEIWIDQELNILSKTFNSFQCATIESDKRLRDAEMYFFLRKYKKLWVNPNSNLAIALETAFDEFASMPYFILDPEFNYKTFKTLEERFDFRISFGGSLFNVG